MKQNERVCTMRIIRDLIEADGIIDSREISSLESLKDKYSITTNDEVAAASTTLADALNQLSHSDNAVKKELLADIEEVAMSDNFCAREEALLILAVTKVLRNEAQRLVSVVSVDAANFYFEDSQMIYVESEFDKTVNDEICHRYRELCTEIRLAGFEFVYLPKISEHYRSIPEKDLSYMAHFLYPKVSAERLKSITSQLCCLSTERFCKDQLSAKLGIKEMETVAPSLMIKIGNSMVDDHMIGNFLLIEVDRGMMETVRELVDIFSQNFRNERINYLKEEKGRFVFKGFYKQIFDILILRRGIRSTVLLDPLREQILFPEADDKIEKIHRREKALYALFLFESQKGGINFNKPDAKEELPRYRHRMEVLQQKYQIIYRMFGGEMDKAPNLEPESRMPMMSLLKKQILRLGETLYHAEDYTIQRNAFGNYSINIPPNLCLCIEEADGKPMPLNKTKIWRKLAEL